MSANSAVTVFRSPSRFSEVDAPATRIRGSCDVSVEATARRPNCAPQSAQNLALGALSEPHLEQRFDNGLPHSAQNFLSGIPSAPHLPRRILVLQLFEQGLGVLEGGGVEALGEQPLISAGTCDHLKITAPNHPWIE